MKRLIAGIDWGHNDNQLVVMNECGVELGSMRYSASPQGVDELCEYLFGLVATPDQLQVAIEDASRPVALALLERGARLFVVEPKKLAAYRKVHRMALVKDDLFDAWLLADMLRAHPNNPREVQLPDASVEVLKRWSRQRTAVVKERVAVAQALSALLDDYYPQILALPWPVYKRVILDLLQLTTDPRELGEADLPSIQRALGRCRKLTADQVLAVLLGPHRHLPDEVMTACAEIASHRLSLLLQLRAQEQAIDTKIAELLEEQVASDDLSNAAIVMSLPGAGQTVTAVLLSEASVELTTGDKTALRNRAVAPVTSQTGKQHPAAADKPFVRRRYSVNARLASAMYHLGNEAKKQSSHYRQLYQAMRARGLSHGRSCRQLADRILDVLFAMLRDRKLYDSTLHGATRR